MIINLIEKTDLSQNFHSQWFAMDYSQRAQKMKAHALIIKWDNVSGSMQGSLQIIGSPDGQNETIAAEVAINTQTNANDSYVFLITSFVRFIKFKFISNGTTSGKLTCKLEFKQR